MGTTYQAGDYGTIQAGAAKSSFDAVNAWRYRFGYNVDVSENLNLGYTNEQIGAGFGDLSSYGGGGVGTAQTRNTLSAGVPIHGWGTLSGTYSGLREHHAVIAARRLAQHVRGADREAGGGRGPASTGSTNGAPT